MEGGGNKVIKDCQCVIPRNGAKKLKLVTSEARGCIHPSSILLKTNKQTKKRGEADKQGLP